MTTAKKATKNPAELATAKDIAITVKATTPAPIAVDVSNAFDTFTARPGVAASLTALSKTKDGFIWVWESEQEQAFGRSVVIFFWQVFQATALPLLSLVWLALNKGYVWAIASEARSAASKKWSDFQAWLAPKFAYSRPKDEQLSIIEK